VLNNQLSVFTEEFLASFDGFPKLLENFTEECRLNRNTQDWYSHICGSEIQDTVEPAIIGCPDVRPYER
jgi:hypothetical protein